MLNNPILTGRLRDPEPEPVGGFDAAAFKAEIMAEMNKGLNGAFKSLKGEIAKMLKPESPPPNPPSDPPADPPADPKIDPALNARLQALERTNKTLAEEVTAAKKAREEAENKQRETSRQSTIRDVLAGIEFRDDAARKDAYKVIAGDIVYDDDGNLIASTDKGAVSAEEHIKAYFADNSRAYMLAPKGGGGSGAKPGTRQAGGGYVPRITDDVSKLTPEQREVYRQHVASTMLEAQSGAQ